MTIDRVVIYTSVKKDTMSISELPNSIIRLSKPNKFDQYPQGTECIVDNEKSLYLQTSSDEENPNWELIKKDKKDSFKKILPDW